MFPQKIINPIAEITSQILRGPANAIYLTQVEQIRHASTTGTDCDTMVNLSGVFAHGLGQQ
jgi:hypothetical protein